MKDSSPAPGDWQGAIRETTSPVLLHGVNDFAWQDQTEPGCAEHERDHGTNTCDRMARVNDQPGRLCISRDRTAAEH
jgi:hypothetical protein